MFQMASDTITKVMQKQGCKIFASLDNFVMVLSMDDAGRHFQALSDFLDELGTPYEP